MGYLFVTERLVVDPSITATDSTLIKAKGCVWHKSSMEKGEMPCPGIDTDARWGYSHTKGWIFGYKLHLTSTTGDLIVPLTADVTLLPMYRITRYTFFNIFFFGILFTIICIVYGI